MCPTLPGSNGQFLFFFFFKLKRFIFIFMYVYMYMCLLVCMCVTFRQCPQRSEKAVRSGIGGTGICELSDNTGAGDKMWVLIRAAVALTAELALQLLRYTT